MLTFLAILSLRRSAATRRVAVMLLAFASMLAAALHPLAVAEEAAEIELVGATADIVPPPANVKFLRPFDGRPAPVVKPRAAMPVAQPAVEAKTQAAPRMIDVALEFAFEASATPAPAQPAARPDAQSLVDPSQIRITGVASYFTPLPVLGEITPVAAAEPIASPPAMDRRIYRPITQLTVDAALPPGPLPETERPPSSTSGARTPEIGDDRTAGAWGDAGLEWAASRMWHRPLYFEEVNLERHGYGVCPLLQPAVSSAHFFLTVPALPHKIVAECPRDCVYTLGYYRPGSCVPWQRNWPPCSFKGGAAEAATVVGLVFLIP